LTGTFHSLALKGRNSHAVLVMHALPLFLAGPTGAGKSAIALEVAQQLDGEIVSVDSMQVYRGMNIGTAKPSAAEQRLVPHHLIDVVELDQSFDVAQFVRLAQEALVTIRSRGRTPIFCGGTGLYFQAFLQGLGDSPPADPELRACLEAQPLPDLLRELEVADPVCYRAIDRLNRRRVVRALEVIRLSERPFSGQLAAWARGNRASSYPASHPEVVFFAIERARDDLRQRIDLRVDRMFASGLVAEVRQLLVHGLAENKTALQALGYRQVVEHLRGERCLETTIALVKQKTRQYAKRQMTWFRQQPAVEWIPCAVEQTVKSIAQALCGRYLGRPGSSPPGLRASSATVKVMEH
jgi:tRNA dimethylallyltransferase